MKSTKLYAMRDIVLEDIGNRGLATDPDCNLTTELEDDFRLACHSIGDHPNPKVGIVTGFYIAGAQPDPVGETDGPLGAVFLARALAPLGIEVAIYTDGFCSRAIAAGLAACNMHKKVNVYALPSPAKSLEILHEQYYHTAMGKLPGISHLIALERPGPTHSIGSVQMQFKEQALGQTYLDFLSACPDEYQGRCLSMRGIDITEKMSPAHWLFEFAYFDHAITTIGIGDGGNEIGMGKMPWDVIHRNIPNGGRIACRVPTTLLIVAGISNWGAYALAAGVWLVRKKKFHPVLADPENERKILQIMVEKGPLVDGVTKKQQATVDGIDFDRYIQVLPKLAEIR
jgi:hypothetical protein